MHSQPAPVNPSLNILTLHFALFSLRQRQLYLDTFFRPLIVLLALLQLLLLSTPRLHISGRSCAVSARLP